MAEAAKTKYVVVCPVDSIWGTVDKDTKERRDVKKLAEELEKTLQLAGYTLVHHPDRGEGESPRYWDEENLGQIAEMLYNTNGIGATVYMYADGYKKKIAVRDGDSDNYTTLNLEEWIKQFGKYEFITMREGVGCPVEISLDINQIPRERITEELEENEDVMCKAPHGDQPKGTFLIVSEGGNRKKSKSFHNVAIEVYSSEDFDKKDIAYWAGLRKREAGGKYFDRIQSKYSIKGGIFYDPEELGVPARLRQQNTTKYKRQIVRTCKLVDPQVSTNFDDWGTIGGFKDGRPFKVIMAEEDDGSKMYAGGYYTDETGYTGFVVDARFYQNFGAWLEQLVNKNAPLTNDPEGPWQRVRDVRG